MRLFKSRKSGEYSDVSSVVANENDPHVKIVSCNSQQEFHNDANNIENGSAADNNQSQQQQQQPDANDNSTNGFLDEQKKQLHIHHNNIPYSLKSSDNGCNDKFTPIPDCDQIDESTNIYEDTSSDNSSTTTAAKTSSAAAATMQETKLYSDSTSDFINELFATLDNLETKLSIQDDNDSISIDTISENVDIKSESSTNSTDGKIKFIGQNGQLPDYKVVKAVPVIVLDSDGPKESRNMFTWGRRMSKKFELLRRNDSRKMHEDGSASGDLNGRSVFTLKNMPKPGDEPSPMAATVTTTTPSPPSNSINSYSFKTFFHRIGSTGMLSRSNQSNSKQLNDTRTLYRSSSTSQLNTPSYVKGDDPTDGINLCNRPKTHETKIKSENKHHHHHHHHHLHVNDNYLNKNAPVKAASYDDIAHVAANEQASKRSNFPYAFLRSKLSVLPEENGGSVINQKRILREMHMLDSSSIDFKAQPVIDGDGDGDDNDNENNNSKQRHQQSTEDVVENNSNTEHSTPNKNGTCDAHPQSPRFTYQRFSNCFSSNESGYDSDNRHTEEHNNGTKSTTPKEEFSVRRLSAKFTPQLSIRKRYKHVKLQRKSLNDVVGIEVISMENDLECRYIVSNLSGLAQADGRICVGDEVLNVNCIDLRGMKSYEKHGAYGNVQEMLSTFVDDSVELVITHDEPTTCGDRLDTKLKTDLHIGYDLSTRTSANYSCNDTNGTQFSEKPLIDVAMPTLNRPKNVCMAWNNRATELKPLQNFETYVPVYGDKNKTANNEERWRILGKKRIDLLSKYGYSSHRETKATETSTAHDNQYATENKHKHIKFDNCYILGETKLTPYQNTQQMRDGKTQNRHSFCEYKPFSARKIDFPKLKFYTPMDYKSIHFNQDLSKNPVEKSKPLHTSIESDTLIGESVSNVVQQHSHKRLTTIQLPNELEDMSIGPFCDQKTFKEKETENQKDHQKFIFFKVYFQKGVGMKSLGFSIVGGRDSPKGSIGIFVKTIFSSGQASDNGNLLAGDEILSLNNESLKGASHLDVIAMFKNIKEGPVMLDVKRRKTTMRAKSLDSVQ
ncbi:uncharacterized protein LOC129573927 [Sitodiplosis mosellana]|uniref:uncharacterized protein LOC129573927 n=1 Tax=Sitodiplosis mosellana TaxID=263140 RepID=UPI002444AF5A|nr:uncharacterized protein LOC129573927 [Sitodiplosis mosellana]XP_055311093.1 uncharacterized protein LOC129573927 [Sitodiplosis mosellana]XP_055311094.1 uncharacterized protein LOC129573927 [Sitodiplosis mosellana]XP_055311095.1 uncharacterized protein LOC129573927 [Sitodiplosis mosellana]XP_055311096.1 uncharacterized protein LOC129573927 [Sitodiplosis mosellana]